MLNLQDNKIDRLGTDYPEKHNQAMDEIEAIVNNMLAAYTAGFTFKGEHDASTGSYPADPDPGDSWIISDAGTISGTDYLANDVIVYGGSDWFTHTGTSNVFDPAAPGEIGGDTPAAASFTTGAFSGALTITDTTASTSGSSGSIKTAGGIGSQKDIVTDETFKPLGDTAAGDAAALGYTATEGAILTGQGSTNDVTIKNDADQAVMKIPTGTQNVDFNGEVNAAGNITTPALLQGTHTDATATGSETPDFSGYSNFNWTVTGNLTLVNPSDEIVNQCGLFTFVMGGAGSYTLSVGTDYENEPVLEGAAGEIVVVPYTTRATGQIIFGNPTRYTP